MRATVQPLRKTVQTVRKTVQPERGKSNSSTIGKPKAHKLLQLFAKGQVAGVAEARYYVGFVCEFFVYGAYP